MKSLHYIIIVVVVAMVGAAAGYLRLFGSPVVPASTTAAQTDTRGQEEPRIQISSSASLEQMDLKALAKQADWIVVGRVTDLGSRRWSTENGGLPAGLTVENFPQDLTLFTDVTFAVEQVVVGAVTDKTLLVRRFGGEADGVRLIIEPEPTFELGNTYLLFLVGDAGFTAKLGPAHTIVLGSVQGVYNLEGDQAVSQMSILASDSEEAARAAVGVHVDELIRQVTALSAER